MENSIKDKFADLHVHTDFSDSTYSPEEVVRASLKARLSCISITDHDTVEGIVPTITAAQNTDLEVIAGIEMTSEIDNQEIHILGYFIDYTNEDLLGKLLQLKQIRQDRIYKMVEKLKNLGIEDIDADDVISVAGHGTVGRLHLAVAMQKKGYITSIYEAFHRYIGDNDPAYVGKFRFSPQEVIEAISKSAGVAVLAHPHNLSKEEVLSKFVDYGLKGLEVYYPEYTASQISHYVNLAKKFGLIMTGGSDSHGKAKENVAIGKVKIPYELVEELKAAR
jgi:predicted metal-dependent phosphoesterase TrpH